MCLLPPPFLWLRNFLFFRALLLASDAIPVPSPQQSPLKSLFFMHLFSIYLTSAILCPAATFIPAITLSTSGYGRGHWSPCDIAGLPSVCMWTIDVCVWVHVQEKVLVQLTCFNVSVLMTQSERLCCMCCWYTGSVCVCVWYCERGREEKWERTSREFVRETEVVHHTPQTGPLRGTGKDWGAACSEVKTHSALYLLSET